MAPHDLFAAAPELMRKWAATSLAAVSSLEPSLMHLVEIRASQINGYANCINMHTQEARAKGETEQRVYLLSAWREAPCYSDRERAALGWTEALTRLSEGQTHQNAYEAVKTRFSDEEQVKLTLMINVINGWNRISLCPLSEASRRRSAFVHKSVGLGCRAGVLWPLYIPLAAPNLCPLSP